MPIKVTCSNCGGVLHAPDDAGGKRGRCPTCGNILPIPVAGGGGGAGELPDAPAAPGGQRPPSFADFALGPQVGPPPGGSSDAARASVAARSSIPFGSSTAEPGPPQRAARTAEPEPRRAADPFARKGKPAPRPAADPGHSDATAKGWKRSRGGLGWVQAANFLLFIPAVLLPGYYVAEAVMKATAADGKAELIPYKDPGYLGLEGVDSRAELVLAACGVPVLLAILLNVFGRLSFAGAPRRSAVGGPAMLSGLASLLALCCAIAVVFPNVFAIIEKAAVFPSGTPLFAHDSGIGLAQRLGILIGISTLVVGEFWFSSAIGRVGSALSDGKPAARSTRYQMLLGLVVIGMVGTAAVAPSNAFGVWAPVYENEPGGGDFPKYQGQKEAANNPAYEVGRETNETVAWQWRSHVSPLFAKADKFQPVIAPGVCLLVGLVVWLMHLRMVGAARGAMAGWLDAHGGAA
jgi:hypothetical protein